MQQAIAGELPPTAVIEVDSSYKNEKDIFVSACRRKYIPPLMECFQDMLVISVYNYERSASEEDKNRASRAFLRNIHQRVVDTLHPYNMVNLNIYHVFAMQKANSLLMDELTMDFFEQQLNIRPELASHACNYVKSILQIFKEAAGGNVVKKREFKSMIFQLTKNMEFYDSNTGQKQN